jgi:hypothetical protein
VRGDCAFIFEFHGTGANIFVVVRARPGMKRRSRREVAGGARDNAHDNNIDNDFFT